ncbi:hypothetical protein VNO77_24140 [Canavalia gladiata]|uniref:Pre-mRNA polyadenylation factor Fip1 domain-containing protein n=1 Tax=Canavalia gladiata TaxID=3824 RepID=A0AAN9QCC1_CANGL
MAMQEDDEFGDLYTDVIQPFAPSSSSPNSPRNPQPIHRQESPQQRCDVDFDHVKESSVDLIDRDVKFDIEDEAVDDTPVIPGLSGDAIPAEEASRRIDEGDDWDSDDSEDDLQIVLDNNNLAAMGRSGLVADGGDHDGGLNIMVDPNQGTEEQDWGENPTQPVEGERKDVGESGKALAPKIGGYHPFHHSQFKYVRPGAASIPGVSTSAPGGPPGQIRPLANMNLVAGRGRGEWRPAGIKGASAMQKGFQAGPGLPIWGNNAAGRSFGGGLEFTLPSHKTVFEVDIDGFEEKPWKYPGVDVSDFFNFGLNEDSWKDYCKQLEQLRLESRMQSKIRVYESSRTEQGYDPDMPPELAAASGIHAVPVDNANSVKSDVGQNDLMKGSGPMRPPIPTGRAIQVESGYGERLPSIDTRPPRIRDSDAIIEIVLQDPPDDSSCARIDVQDEQEGGELLREDFREDHVVGHEIPRIEPKYCNGSPQDYNGQKRELVGRRMPSIKASPTNIPEEDENLPLPQKEPIGSSDSRHQTPRQVRGQSPCITCSEEMTLVDNQKEKSVESMEGRHKSSPVIKAVRESSMENKNAELEETGTADERLEKEDIDLNTVDKRDTIMDEVVERQKVTSQVGRPLLGDGNDWEDSKAVSSSDNSKTKSESSRDHHKPWDSLEEEVVQDPRSVHLGSIRLQPDENEQVFRRREHDGRQEPKRNCMVVKGREEPYPFKDRNPGSLHQLHTKINRFDMQKDRDSSDRDWARRDGDLYGRRVRNDGPRKRDRGRAQENERSDNEDSFHSRKQLDNCNYRVPYEKDVGTRVSRHKERDDSLKGKHEAVEDFHGKRMKNEEYFRREHVDKEVLHGYKENVSRHKREKDEVLDHPRKKFDHKRNRDNLDDQHAAKQKNEAWLLRERGDRQRDREEWHRVKQSHEEHLSKHKRGRSSLRSGQGVEEKALFGHVRAKDEHKASEKEYQSREATRHSDQLKMSDRIQGESPHHKEGDDAYTHGNQYSSEERRSRKEKSNSHGGRATNALDSQRVHERKHKEGSRKSKESIVGSLGSLGVSKRSPGGQSGQINEKGMKGSGDDHAEDEIPGHCLPRKHEGISSDDEQQDSQRGRSKYERWTSHKEADFRISSKSSSSLKFKDLDKDNNDVSSVADDSTKIVDSNNQPFLSVERKDFVDMELKDANAKGLGDRHLDTAEKLKKRSERFKLPMPNEKEAQVIKKLESEPLPSAKNENPVDSAVKQERPARKRRWIRWMQYDIQKSLAWLVRHESDTGTSSCGRAGPSVRNRSHPGEEQSNRCCLLPNLCLRVGFEMSVMILFVVYY